MKTYDLPGSVISMLYPMPPMSPVKWHTVISGIHYFLHRLPYVPPV